MKSYFSRFHMLLKNGASHNYYLKMYFSKNMAFKYQPPHPGLSYRNNVTMVEENYGC